MMIVSGSFFAYRTLQSEGFSPRDLLESNSAWVPEIVQNRVEVRLISLTVQQGRAAVFTWGRAWLLGDAAT